MSALFPLQVTNAVTRRRGKTLVGPISLRLDGGTTLAVIGPNGAGKTSLLRLLHGTARLSAGRIDWACPIEQARAAQSFVFQRPVMLRRSVLENLIYPLRARGMAPATAQTEAKAWANRVNLSGMLARPATSLSGGEQQKLALARALITKPEVVFLDEPCAALDGRSTREIEDILFEAKASGMQLVLATHDMGQARRLADDVLFLIHGHAHETAPAAEFFAQPNTTSAAVFLRGDIVE